MKLAFSLYNKDVMMSLYKVVPYICTEKKIRMSRHSYYTIVDGIGGARM